jgi:predicted ArsR family transcriptional regulator
VRALPSDLAWKILDSLVAKDLTPAEIGDSLGVKARVLGPHLDRLVKAGIVVPQERKLASGRKLQRYGITEARKSVGFPPRRYVELSASLINGIRRSIGEDGARMILRDIGLRIGGDIVQAMSSRFNVREWTPRTYSEYFVNAVLAEMQTQPKILNVGKTKVVYEQLNCPFQELAASNPVLICDVLDEAVHKGVDSNLGASRTTRLKCKGHGDSTCRYLVQWRVGGRNAKTMNGSRLMKL